ncbi:MAG TPA: kelch repeat-containing protein [Gaiellaceae bacterium]
MLSVILLALAAALAPTPAQKLGFPPVKPGPVPGYVMIADRNNNRIIMVSPSKKIVWQKDGLHDPDDAFFTTGYKSISTNEEYNQTMALIGVRSRRVTWSYGHADVRGSSPGYMSNPDDAYLLPNGLMQVADIENCRVLWVNRAHRIVRSIGHAGDCTHDPPRTLSSPNGDTPLPDGGVLITEIGGWVDRISATGKLVYTVRTPTTYPSDAQLLPNGDILVAGFNMPGRVDEITPSGKIVWTWQPTGEWTLNRPSLAVRWPNGLIALTDDWNHRVLVVNPRTKKVVWSYGHLGSPGIAPGYLNKPDGLDLLPAVPGGVKAARKTVSTVQRIGSLPQALSKASAVALPGGRLMVLGGYTGSSSIDSVLLGTPQRLRMVGRLPAPTHDAAAAVLGTSIFLFGGGESVSVDTIDRVSLAGSARSAGKLDEPLSDLGAAVVGGKVYLVGGYTGSAYASAILRYDGGGRTTTVARLPAGTRYAGVAVLGGRIVVAGGITPSGTSSTVYSIDPATRKIARVATLPAPEAHAGMAALENALYLVGGNDVLRIVGRSVTVAAHLPVSLSDPAVVALDGRIVIVGGGTTGVFAFTPR